MPHDDQPRKSFAGFYKPYTTPVPDNFFDEVLPDLSGAEVKVLLYIFRRTFGWKKDSDNISLSQLVSGITKRDGTVLDRGTGLSKPTVSRTLQQLVAKGMLRKTRRHSTDNGDEPTTYEPVIAGEIPVLNNATRGVSKVNSGVLQNPTHKKQLYKKTVKKNNDREEKTAPKVSENAGGKTPLKELPDLTVESELVDLIADDIVAQLGDEQSRAFYRLVARKIPEAEIRATLAEIKQDGAREPQRLFTYRVQQYALKRLYGKE